MLSEKFLNYYKANVSNDVEEVKTICEAASKVIYDRFRIKIKDHEVVAVIFSCIYQSILQTLKDKESQFDEFEVNVCDRLLIGYSTTNNDDDEKQGNFQIYIRHLNSSRKNDDIAEADAKTDERLVIWNATNLKCQPKLLQEISVKATDYLKENGDIVVQASESIIPMFATIYEMIIVFLTTKRREVDAFDYRINFCSCFDIGARETEDDLDEIYLIPDVTSKLALKNDEKATAKFE